jgi:TRAP-type mannitol/chloroaromatic compound transport system permease large subunit
VMKGIVGARTSMQEIVFAALPYLFCAVLMVVLLLVFPDIALLLPRLAIK